MVEARYLGEWVLILRSVDILLGDVDEDPSTKVEN